MSNNLTITIKENQLRFSDQLVSDSMSHNQLVDILKLSIEEQETDLKIWVDALKEKSHGHLLWAATWTDLRQDDLVGLNWYYFLEQVIVYVQKHFAFQIIHVAVPTPAIIAKYLQGRYNFVQFTEQYPREKRLRTLLSPLKLLPALLRTPGKQSIAKNGYWVKAPIQARRHRYRELLAKLDDGTPHQFFHANHNITVQSHGLGESLNFSRWAKANDFTAAWRVGKKLKGLISQSKSENLLLSFLKQMPLLHFAGMRLREIWIERAVENQQPKAIFFTTANTYSPARLMSRIAFRHNVPFYIVACRSMFTSLRMEERAIQIDHDKVNDAHVTDAHIVWDEFSRATLIEQGFDAEKIYLHQSAREKRKTVRTLENRFLILFTHDREQNESLLDALESVERNGQWSIRTHPLQPLSAHQINRVNQLLPGYLDISQWEMNKTAFQDVIALSINSTAAVEACSYGTAVIWLPFLNFRAILFDEVMKILGVKANNLEELDQLLEQYSRTEERKQLINRCDVAYQRYFTGKDTLYDLLNKINTRHAN